MPQTGAQGKMYVSAVLLPDGRVFETGGALHNRADPVYEASMFDPVTDTWQAGMATDPASRGYHSSTFLLPDGRVMAVGDNPGDGSFTDKVSVYTPPYLFKGPRPQITSVARQRWAYGSTQRITVDRPVVRAELIRPAAVTHSSDPNQRFVDLPMTVRDDGRTSGPERHQQRTSRRPAGTCCSPSTRTGCRRWRSGCMSVRARGRGARPARPRLRGRAGGGPEGAAARAAVRAGQSEGVGCERAYGSADVCVPTAFPASVKPTTRDRCTWLEGQGYGPLAVNTGRDPLRLDRDRDGTACGPGDVRRR